MGATALPEQDTMYSETMIRNLIIDGDRKLVSSIQLPGSHHGHLGSAMFHLNDQRAVQNVWDESTRRHLLHMNGIHYQAKNERYTEYVIAIFQTEILVCYQSQDQTAWLKQKQRRRTYRQIPLTNPSHEVKKVQNLAIRALYALGLDYGVVICGAQSGRRVTIHRIIPNPQMNDEMEREFVRAIRNYSQSLHKPRNQSVTLGADPEFIMVNSKGNLLLASSYFPTRGRIGCDAIWWGTQRSNKPLVEIRPEPSPDPKKLMTRIYQHMWQAGQKMKNVPCKWLAGALPYQGYPIGGHIHFTGVSLNFKLLRALDNYLTLPLVMSEDRSGRKRRPKYGFLGDYRRKPHGGFEYRTPPSWLISPTLTKGVLILAKLIGESYDQLQLNPLSEVEMQKAYYSGDKERIKNWWPLLWHDLEQLEGFEIYRTELQSYYRYLSSGVDWNEKRDIRRAWRIPPHHQKR